MMPQRWRQIEDLFHRLQQARILDSACAVDPDLRREVERLLADRTGSRLLDLSIMKTRELTRLNNAGAIRSFDISPDGNIVFDRLRGNSHVVLIDLPGDRF